MHAAVAHCCEELSMKGFVVTTLLLISCLIFASRHACYAAESLHPALSYWNDVLPGVDMPDSLSKALSPLSASDAGFYTDQIKAKGLQSLVQHSATFCDAAHVMCADRAAIRFFPCPSCKDYRRRRLLRYARVQSCEDRYPSAPEGRPGEYFREDVLSVGQQVPVFGGLQDDPRILNKAFLPRNLAQVFPFNTKQLPDILDSLNIPEASDMATGTHFTLQICGNPSREGITDRACFSSVEDMADFVAAHLNGAMKANVLTFAQGTSAIVGHPVKVLDVSLVSSTSAKHVSCHRFVYPYQVYLCHGLGPSSKVYSLSIQAKDGTVITNVGAACHGDTSRFIKSHPAFIALKLKPGEGEVCHWLLSNSLVFTQA